MQPLDSISYHSNTTNPSMSVLFAPLIHPYPPINSNRLFIVQAHYNKHNCYIYTCTSHTNKHTTKENTVHALNQSINQKVDNAIQRCGQHLTRIK